MLLHASWLHLLTSLCVLLLLGFYLEGSWGVSLFSGVALGSTIAAASVFGALVAAGAGTWIGSSGLLAGLLGAFAVRFGAGWRDPSRATVFAAGALVLAVPLLIGVQWSVVPEAGPLAVSTSGLAYAAAFVFGAVAAAGIRVAQLEQVFGRPAPPSGVRSAGGGAQLERALEHRAAGRLDQSFTTLVNRLRQEPNDRDAALALWDVASDLGRPAAAAPALLGVIRDEVKRGDAAQAVEHWLELAEAGLERDAEPALAIRIAALLAAADQRTAAAHALQHALARAEGASGAGARVAGGARRLVDRPRDRRAGGLARARLGRAHARGAPEPRGIARGGAAAQRRSREQARRATPRGVEARARAGREAAPARPFPWSIRRRSCWRSSSRMRSRPGSRSRARRARPSPKPNPARPRPPRATKPEAIEIETASRTLEAIFAVPTEFDAEGVCITASNGAKKRVRYDRIAAISVVAVSGLGPKPVILVDLILNWMSLADEPLRIIRLRGDRFDPRRLAPDHAAPVDALRAIIERLLHESNATPLPDLQSAQGLPFAGFDDLGELSPRRADGRFRERGSLRLEQLARSLLRAASGGRRRGVGYGEWLAFLFS